MRVEVEDEVRVDVGAMIYTTMIQWTKAAALVVAALASAHTLHH